MEKQLFQDRRWKELGAPIVVGKVNMTEEQLREGEKRLLKRLLLDGIITKEEYIKEINKVSTQ